MANVNISVNFGPAALIEDLSGFIADLGTICHFASELQRVADRNQAVYEVLRGRAFPLDPEELHLPHGGNGLWFWGTRGLTPSDLDRAVARQLRVSEAESNEEIRVRSLAYQNPLSVDLLAGGAVVLAVLRMLRDWPARRRVNDAAARDYESAVRAREELRREIVRGVLDSGSPLTSEQVTELISADVERAMLALRDVPLSIQGLDDTPGEG